MFHWVPLEEADAVVPSAEDEYLANGEADPLDVLTDRQRFVIELRFGLKDGNCYSLREIAEYMGIGFRTVWKHEQAAKKRLNRATKQGDKSHWREDS